MEGVRDVEFVFFVRLFGDTNINIYGHDELIWLEANIDVAQLKRESVEHLPYHTL